MVVKNTMLRLAVKGTQYEGLTEYFEVTRLSLSVSGGSGCCCSHPVGFC